MAYDVNGTSQDFTADSSPVSGTPLTMACWFRADNNTAPQQLLAVYDTLQSVYPYYALSLRGDLSGDPVQAISYRSGSAQAANSTVGYSTGVWSHACAVYASATSRTVYLNGGNSATDTGTTTAFTPTKFRIAVYMNQDGTKQFWLDGLIAEVGVWSAALSGAEVASLAAGVSCRYIRPQSLAFYAPLVRDLIDVRGGLTITNNGSATVANHPRVYA